MSKTDQSMVYVGGSKRSFRCDYKVESYGAYRKCGCNVFTKLSEEGNKIKYQCNSCRMTYTGEK